MCVFVVLVSYLWRVFVAVICVSYLVDVVLSGVVFVVRLML